MLEKGYYDKADTIIKSHGAMEASLIPIIQDIQSEYRYLPPELLSYVADQIGITEAKADSRFKTLRKENGGVSSARNAGLDKAKGKYVIKVCDGTACHVRKSTTILERIYSELGLSKDKVTTEDMLFTVETVSCLGACGLAPVLTVNDKVYPSMTPDDAAQLLQKLREEE